MTEDSPRERDFLIEAIINCQTEFAMVVVFADKKLGGKLYQFVAEIGKQDSFTALLRLVATKLTAKLLPFLFHIYKYKYILQFETNTL